jgi:hypothetical protein
MRETATIVVCCKSVYKRCTPTIASSMEDDCPIYQSIMQDLGPNFYSPSHPDKKRKQSLTLPIKNEKTKRKKNSLGEEEKKHRGAAPTGVTATEEKKCSIEEIPIMTTPSPCYSTPLSLMPPSACASVVTSYQHAVDSTPPRPTSTFMYLMSPDEVPHGVKVGLCLCFIGGHPCTFDKCINALQMKLCTPSNCSHEGNVRMCTTRNFQFRFDSEDAVNIMPVPGGKGLGIFAKSKFEDRNVFLMPLLGKLIPAGDLCLTESSMYGLQLKRGDLKLQVCFESFKEGNFGRLVNHSCFPNAVVEQWQDSSGMPILVFKSIRPIYQGDEITIDYQYDIEPMCMCQVRL